ncbi:DUF393 domain-containing protein [bacterium]|nr:DUF393 domain-containing protein [bacterium]
MIDFKNPPAPLGRHGMMMYDGSCGVCTTTIGNRYRFYEKHGVSVVPLQTPGLVEWSGLTYDQLLSAIHLITPDGQIYKGPDALIYVMNKIGWMRPLAWPFKIRIFKTIFGQIYGAIAKRRQKISQVCGLKGRS